MKDLHNIINTIIVWVHNGAEQVRAKKTTLKRHSSQLWKLIDEFKNNVFNSNENTQML